MDRSQLVKTFFDDASSFIDRLNNTLMHLEKDRDNLNLVHQAFRFVHSIKSESSYLMMDDITKAAHNLETLLDIIRKEKRGVGPEDMRNLYEGVDELESRFHTVEAVQEEESEEIVRPGENRIRIGDLERMYLQEARARGEILCRLSCEIDESAPMKKSRAFLLVNNLELIVNVITVSPQLDEERDEQFRRCTVVFTSDLDEDAVRDAVSVDQVKRVQISRLDYGSLLDETPEAEVESEMPVVRQEGFYRVPSGALDEILEYMDQIKLSMFRMSGEGKDISGLEQLADSLEALLKDIRKVRLASYFAGFGRLVRDLAEKLGKKVEFEMNFGDISLDRNSAELLSDVMVHIIRNAVDHGIEKPEERLEAGKVEYGTLELTAEIDDGTIRVSLRDDGRGIDEDEVRNIARTRGLAEDPDKVDLIHILALPGFSTREEATDYSGRGVGLDVITGRLEKTQGGGMELINVPGDGSTFTVTVPLIYNPVGILLVRCGDETFAVPLKNLKERFSLDPARYESDEKGFLTYNGEPVFSTEGRIFSGKDLPEEKFGVVLQHLGDRGVLLTDELLFEKEIPEDSLILNREIRPHIFSLGTGEGDPGYLYVNPSLISRNL